MGPNATVPRLKFHLRTSPSKSEVRSVDPETEVSFLPMEAVGEYGGLDLERTRPLAEVMDGYTYFRNGDVVVAKITPCFENGKGALAADLSNGIAFGTTELHVLRALDELDSRYLFYLTISHRFRKLGESTMYGAGGQKRVPDDFIREYRHEMAPLPRQRALAAFLERETVKVDALIERKRRLLDLLDEKRTALITRAVTCGLDRDLPNKDSGVEWLGEIPAHWEVELNRRLFRQTHQRSKAGEEELLSVSHITGVTPRSEKPDVTMIEAESHEGYRICEAGDLAVNTMWAWMGALGIAGMRGIVSPSYNVFRIVTDNLLPAYYDYVSRTPAHVAEIIRYSKGVWKSRLRLYPDAFALMTTPIPPLREQMQIVEFLDREGERMEGLSQRIHRAISLLHEYRAALISATVSGQVDISEAGV